jgi:hypothetical protein
MEASGIDPRDITWEQDRTDPTASSANESRLTIGD